MKTRPCPFCQSEAEPVMSIVRGSAVRCMCPCCNSMGPVAWMKTENKPEALEHNFHVAKIMWHGDAGLLKEQYESIKQRLANAK